MAKEAKNEIIENEVIEEAKAEETLNENVEVTSSADDLESVNPFEEENTANYSREGSTTVFEETGVLVFQEQRPDKTGELWINCECRFKKVVRGKPFVHKMRMVPGTERGKDKKFLNDLCMMVFGDEKSLPLQIVKTVTEINGARRTRYTARICYKDESGVEYICPISPVGDGGAASWTNLISILLHDKKIT